MKTTGCYQPDELRVVPRREDRVLVGLQPPPARRPRGSLAQPAHVGYLGLCITEQRSNNPLRAREYCQRAVNYNEQNPIAHFLLGNINRDLFNVFQTCDYLRAAASSYSRMLELNEYLAESDNARNYREQITGFARQLRC